jgi:hypothetical protein
MEDALSVYENPYDSKNPQIYLDEIHKDLRSIPANRFRRNQAKIEREDYEYERKGTCALF